MVKTHIPNDKERKNLETFLSERNLDVAQLPQIMGDESFNSLLFELSKLGMFIDRAVKIVKETKNISQAGLIMGVGAKVQKDVVYGVMLNVFGFNLIRGGYGEALKDYVMIKYEKGFKELERNLSE